MLTACTATTSHRFGVIQKAEFKIVYVAPMKALAAEVTANFGRRLAPLGLVVKELTGGWSWLGALAAEVCCHSRLQEPCWTAGLAQWIGSGRPGSMDCPTSP